MKPGLCLFGLFGRVAVHMYITYIYILFIIWWYNCSLQPSDIISIVMPMRMFRKKLSLQKYIKQQNNCWHKRAIVHTARCWFHIASWEYPEKLLSQYMSIHMGAVGTLSKKGAMFPTPPSEGNGMHCTYVNMTSHFAVGENIERKKERKERKKERKKKRKKNRKKTWLKINICTKYALMSVSNSFPGQLWWSSWWSSFTSSSNFFCTFCLASGWRWPNGSRKPRKVSWSNGG